MKGLDPLREDAQYKRPDRVARYIGEICAATQDM